MNAAQITELANEEGIAAVSRELGISRRQAEQVAALARRAFNEGMGLPADAIPIGTVARSKAVHPAGQPRIGHTFTDEETTNLPGAYIDPAERTYAGQAAKQRRYILEKSLANGYREWEHALQEMNHAG